jgi:DNA repair protein RecN (Recombination protein N)
VLEEMRIRGLGVIDDAVLPLGPGLTVVTGETGAGKTMVVQGLGLLFGGRADAGRLRPGAARAVVEGRLVLGEGSAALDRARDAGAELDDDALLVSRSVGVDGRSRAHVGGRSVPVGVLAELADHVLAVHGQSDQQRLLKPAQQRAALDRYAGQPVLALRERFRTHWARWRDVRATLDQLRAEAAERAHEAELLRLGVAEVEAVAPQPGEGAALAAEIERLSNADDLRAAAAAAQQALTGDEDAPDASDALQLLVSARRSVAAVSEHDPELAALAARLAELAHLATDAGAELASYLASVDADPARLAAAQDRQATLTALVRRHAVENVDGVLAWAATASDRLLELDGTGDQVLTLAEQDVALEQALGALAQELSAARAAAALRFGEAVTAELAELAMPHARVSAVVTQRPVEEGLRVGDEVLAATADGVDEVELLLVPHPGAPPRPLQKGASGGELSRVMLAVEVVFAGSDPVPLMVFDEVDAGVGGRAAVEVGRRLARLARDHQVIVVTHLPQVAAFADAHLQVVKAADGLAAGSVTRSGVVVLDDAARVVELSRMLAGADTGLARGHAEELLAAAAQDRAVA